MKAITFTAAILTTISSIAQVPSKEQVKAKLLEGSTKTYKMIVSEPDKRLEKGVYNLYYGYRSYSKTEYPGIEQIYSATVRYIPSGGSYKFDKRLTGNSYFTGIPDPSIEEVERILNLPATQKKFFNNQYYNIIGEVPQLKVTNEPEFFWRNINGFQCNVETTCQYLDGDQLKTIHRTGVVSISRSVDGITWDPKAPYLKDGIWIESKAYFSDSDYEVVETREVSAEEKAQLKTIAQILNENQAKDRMATLPKIDFPEFNSSLHVIQFIHETLLKGDVQTSQALLMYMGGSNYFDDVDAKVLNRNGEELYDLITERAANYPKTYCQHPKIKEQASNGLMVAFYTRDGLHFDRIQVNQDSEGKWKFNYIGGFENDEYANKYEAMGDVNCGEALDTSKPAEIIQYAVGDRVEGEYRGQWHTGTVEKKDDYMENRYWVKFDGMNGQWLTHDQMKPSNSKLPSVQPKTDDAKTTNTNVDKAKSKINGLKGKIKL